VKVKTGGEEEGEREMDKLAEDEREKAAAKKKRSNSEKTEQ